MTQQEAEQVLRKKYLRYHEKIEKMPQYITFAKDYGTVWVFGADASPEPSFPYYYLIDKKTKFISDLKGLAMAEEQIAIYQQRSYLLRFFISFIITNIFGRFGCFLTKLSIEL
jgi:hypothetical protein